MDELLFIVVTPEALFKLIVPMSVSALMVEPLTVIPVPAEISPAFRPLTKLLFKVIEPLDAFIEKESPASICEFSTSIFSVVEIKMLPPFAITVESLMSTFTLPSTLTSPPSGMGKPSIGK